MATLDLSNATAAIDMTDANLVHFGTPDGATSTSWSYLTPTGHDLQIDGQNMTFDASGRAQSGTVNSVTIDFGNDNTPDLTITGLAVEAATLDDGAPSFWRGLEGNDVITGPQTAAGIQSGEFTIFGDGIAARPGAQAGGNDIIDTGYAEANIMGDVMYVGGQDPAVPEAVYRGGADQIAGLATNEAQALLGDAFYVCSTGRLIGGNDSIFAQSTRFGSQAVGDAAIVEGRAGDLAVVVGGNDYLAGGVDSQTFLTGDVALQRDNSFVRGGNDTLNGGDKGDVIVGDVDTVGKNSMVAGANSIAGNGGSDRLYGDTSDAHEAVRVIGGNDTIDGGDGEDYIYGDILGGDKTIIVGGNDRLFGGADDDNIDGMAGNDLLDGGTGVDALKGGAGNDTYVIDNFSDRTFESAGEGIDTVRTLIGNVGIAVNVENMVFIGQGAFAGSGNALNNQIVGGSDGDAIDGREGNDLLFGGAGGDNLGGQAGNDVLVGGPGADILRGGAGVDSVSYVGTQQAVTASLDGSLTAEGEAAGDRFFDVEGLSGTSFGDRLRGDGLANALLGQAGNDTLEGLGGNDLIHGGLGADVLIGGLGNDRFRYTALNDGGDRIGDFSNIAGNNDQLLFDDVAFGGLAAGALAAGRFTANTAGLATTLDQRFIYETDTGILRFDANGSAAGGVTAVAAFTGTPLLTAGDIFIV